MGHDVCEAMGVSATVCADFLDGVVDSLSKSCQRSVMPATKPAMVYSVRTWLRVLSDVFWGRST